MAAPAAPGYADVFRAFPRPRRGRPGDPGLFGPGSMVWRVNGEAVLILGGARALLLQVAHPMVVDPRDPARAFVVPLVSAEDRVTPDGRMRVFETRDRGDTWSGRGEGFPRGEVYLTVLRQAFAHDGPDPLGLYVGATSGDVFASADGGLTWTAAAEHLAPVLSVRASG